MKIMRPERRIGATIGLDWRMTHPLPITWSDDDEVSAGYPGGSAPLSGPVLWQLEDERFAFEQRKHVFLPVLRGNDQAADQRWDVASSVCQVQWRTFEMGGRELRFLVCGQDDFPARRCGNSPANQFRAGRRRPLPSRSGLPGCRPRLPPNWRGPLSEFCEIAAPVLPLALPSGPSDFRVLDGLGISMFRIVSRR